MLKVKKEGVILKPSKLAFESKSVFNPGVLQEGKDVHVIYRAQDDKLISSFGYARLDGPLKVVERWDKPFLEKKYKYEKKGIEDPCIVKIGRTVYVTYVAHDGTDAVIAYLHGPDIFKLKRGGVISAKISYRHASKLMGFSQLKDDYYKFASFYENYNDKNILVWEKDGVLFPEKIRGKFAMFHRVLPDIQLARFSNFDELKTDAYWQKHLKNLAKHVVLEEKFGFESRHIGAGAPPIKTKAGWLMIYHAVQHLNKGRFYYAAAALLDLKNPTKVLGRLPYPLFGPDEKYEQEGHTNNVVFPTDTAIFKNRIYIYYGTSDSYVAVAHINQDKLIKELLKYKASPNKAFTFFGK